MKRPVLFPAIVLTAAFLSSCGLLQERGARVDDLAAVASAENKPFVIVEATKAAPEGGVVAADGQGVIISPEGHVLTVAHVPFQTVREGKEAFFVGVRRRRPTESADVVSRHELIHVDLEDTRTYQERYRASLIRDGKRVQIQGRDLALLKIESRERFPCVPFYSRRKPVVRVGDRLQICQYVFADEPGNPFFMVNPLEVIGVVETPWGTQVLAFGYFRWGSSGSGILKDGKLIGIQSNGFTINAKSGDIALGHLSFEVVYEDLVRDLVRRSETPLSRRDPSSPAESRLRERTSNVQR